MNKNLEYEIRILNINESKLKKTILENKGKLSNKKRIMKIISYHHPYSKKDSYIRIRDEGDKITMTIKTKFKSKFPIEREVIINDIEEGDAILKFLGCKKKYIVEKIRETYKINGCKELVFDSYPGLPTYFEIDCDNENNLKKVSKLLGYNLDDHDNTSTNDLYLKHYGIKKDRKLGDLTFANANKVLGPFITKNKKKFFEILNEQKKLLQ